MERNAIIRELRCINGNIDTLISYLTDHVAEKYDNQSVSEFCEKYDCEGKNFTALFNTLTDEYGGEKLCEFVDNAKTE